MIGIWLSFAYRVVTTVLNFENEPTIPGGGKCDRGSLARQEHLFQLLGRTRPYLAAAVSGAERAAAHRRPLYRRGSPSLQFGHSSVERRGAKPIQQVKRVRQALSFAGCECMVRVSKNER